MPARVRQLLWFVGIWAASVLSLFAVATIIRAMLR
ncbi:MAG: DUF2474 family protein [Hyphomonadaceae bacterium]|nr:DUF2474 family protein [Hyphomonadaceae bacterium]